MERNADFEEISDGKRYKSSDIVKIGCNDCSGCSSCCENMAGLITLDPYDIDRMLPVISENKNEAVSILFSKHISLMADRGIIIPTLKMDENTGRCTFLNESNRCSIHNFRSGICRLFPLGRIYEDNGFSYFLQKDECPHENKTKVKIKNWLDTRDLAWYEKYICEWHYFVRDLQKYAADSDEDDVRQVNNFFLQIFYLTPYGQSFYEEFYERLNKVKALIQG